MELTLDERMAVCNGLNRLVEDKESEITSIGKKTPDDYALQKRMSDKFSLVPFNFEVQKERDVQKVIAEIHKLQDLSNKINSGENRILAVPRFIQLNLTEQ